MQKRQVGLVVGKDFRPPGAAHPLDWCYLTIEVADSERLKVRLARELVDRVDTGDVVRFRAPRSPEHPTHRVVRMYSAPARVPPPVRVDTEGSAGVDDSTE